MPDSRKPKRGVFRAVYSSLLDDPDYHALPTDARLLLLTLRLCRDAGPAAIFRYYPGKLAIQSGLSERAVVRGLDCLATHGWIAYRYPIVWVRNGLRYDPSVSLANPKHVTYVTRVLEELPNSEIVRRFCDYYEIAYPSERVSQSIAFNHREAVTEDRIPNTEDRRPEHPLSRSATARESSNDTARELLDFLNRKAERHYRPVKATLELIRARLHSGATAEQIRAVIAVKCREWRGRADMAQYLRPVTLFRASNFENYLGQLPATAFAPEATP